MPTDPAAAGAYAYAGTYEKSKADFDSSDGDDDDDDDGGAYERYAAERANFAYYAYGGGDAAAMQASYATPDVPVGEKKAAKKVLVESEGTDPPSVRGGEAELYNEGEFWWNEQFQVRSSFSTWS
jgi:hypothetical protein